MEDNYVLCNENCPAQVFRGVRGDDLEPAFELYGEETVSIKYIDKNNSVSSANVIIRFSKVKAKFYDETAFPTGNPGAYPFGKYASKMEGISVVRANREIDFRQFDFYSTTNEPQHRWWGCEIMFDPVLDEAFGVANNKQYVELKRIEAEDIDYEEEVQPIWCQLYDVIYNTIKEMYPLWMKCLNFCPKANSSRSVNGPRVFGEILSQFDQMTKVPDLEKSKEFVGV